MLGMSLEDEVKEILSRSLRASPSILRYHTAGGPKPTRDDETIEQLQSLTAGLGKAILLLARRLDEINDTSRSD
jgi:hypothetical protein